MAEIFALIQQNAGWLFGGSSVAAIVVALLNRKKKSAGRSAKTGRGRTLSAHIIVIALAAMAVLFGGISISNISINQNSINAGDGSRNIIAGDNADVAVDQ